MKQYVNIANATLWYIISLTYYGYYFYHLIISFVSEAWFIQLTWNSWRISQNHRGNEVTVAYISCLRKIFPSYILHWMHGCFLNIMMHFSLAGKRWSGAQILRKCSFLFMRWRFPIKFPIETFSIQSAQNVVCRKRSYFVFFVETSIFSAALSHLRTPKSTFRQNEPKFVVFGINEKLSMRSGLLWVMIGHNGWRRVITGDEWWRVTTGENGWRRVRTGNYGWERVVTRDDGR